MCRVGSGPVDLDVISRKNWTDFIRRIITDCHDDIHFDREGAALRKLAPAFRPV